MYNMTVLRLHFPDTGTDIRRHDGAGVAGQATGRDEKTIKVKNHRGMAIAWTFFSNFARR